jgi:hypothetical protein
VPYGANGVISDDGEWLAYTPYAEGLTEKRKHYYGGFAPDIWLFNLRTHKSRQITDWKGADTSPMWRGPIVYYLSDAGAEARMNIWSYDTKTNTRPASYSLHRFRRQMAVGRAGHNWSGRDRFQLWNGSLPAGSGQ